MSVTINTNSAATIASNNLSASNAMLQKSLNRLSSGSKIVNASDDAGGVAVAARLSAAAKRTSVSNGNIANGLSYLQNQDSNMKTIGKMLERMSELQALHQDETKSSTDKDNYETEFNALGAEIDHIKAQTFNGNAFYSASPLSVVVDEGGSKYTLSDNSALAPASVSWDIETTLGARGVKTQVTGVTSQTAGLVTDNSVTDLTFIVNGHNFAIDAGTSSLTDGTSLVDLRDAINASATAGVSAAIVEDASTHNFKLTLTSKTDAAITTGGTWGATWTNTTTGSENTVTQAIQDLAEARANNGSDQSILGYYAELGAATKTNFESAVSKIMDVDVAEESTQLARWNTLVQAGTAMIAQANGSTQSALTLLR
jgi:flagellin